MELRNEILMRATELGKLLAKTEEVTEYKAAEQLLLKNPTTKERLESLKAMNGNQEALDKAFEELESVQEVKDFQKAQGQVQNLLQTVSQIVADSVRNA